MRHLFLYLSIFLLFTNCKEDANRSKTLSTNAEITEKLKTFYSIYGKFGTNAGSLYDHPVQKDLFSTDLEKVLKEAVNATNASVEKVKKSDHPTDKPAILEGSTFTSLYEGYTSYKIKSVTIDPSGTSADAIVDLEHTLSEPKTTWADQVHLINSDQGWRIDNISFDSIGSAKDLKTSLKSFIQSAQ